MITQEEARTIILNLKKDYGISYKDIADILEISTSHLSLFLSGRRNFKRKILFNLETQINLIHGGIYRNV